MPANTLIDRLELSNASNEEILDANRLIKGIKNVRGINIELGFYPDSKATIN